MMSRHGDQHQCRRPLEWNVARGLEIATVRQDVALDVCLLTRRPKWMHGCRKAKLI